MEPCRRQLRSAMAPAGAQGVLKVVPEIPFVLCFVLQDEVLSSIRCSPATCVKLPRRALSMLQTIASSLLGTILNDVSCFLRTLNVHGFEEGVGFNFVVLWCIFKSRTHFAERCFLTIVILDLNR